MVNNLNMNKPLISVILPVYNAELYVSESIQSILNQTYTNFELIVINDGSTDRSEECILEFKDERIRYFKNQTNLELIDTLNLGLELVQGEYIARMDADDIANPLRFEKQVTILNQFPEYGIVGSFAELIGDASGDLRYVEEDQDIRYALLTHNPFIHSTVMIKSSFIVNKGLRFEKNKLHVEDYDLWIRILTYTKGIIIPESLIKYRIHSNQVSSIYKELQELNTLELQKKYFKAIFNDKPDIDLMSSLYFSKLIDFEFLILFLSQLTVIKKDTYNKLQQLVLLQLEKKCKNLILDKKFLSLNELFSLISFRKYFTLKQKMVLLTKFFKKNINR